MNPRPIILSRPHSITDYLSLNQIFIKPQIFCNYSSLHLLLTKTNFTSKIPKNLLRH